ncbi:MAG: hypothetical protein U0T73_02280 [Chitinophagales bacterium]
MNKKLFVILIGVLWVISLFAFAASWSPYPVLAHSTVQQMLLLAESLSIIFLLWNGSTYKTGYFGGLITALFLFLIGSLFRLLHWPGAIFLLIMAAFFLIGVYTVRFFTKKEKQLSDILKLFLVLLIGVYIALTYYHFQHKLYLRATIGLITLALMVLAIRKYRKDTPLPV